MAAIYNQINKQINKTNDIIYVVATPEISLGANWVVWLELVLGSFGVFVCQQNKLRFYVIC